MQIQLRSAAALLATALLAAPASAQAGVPTTAAGYAAATSPLQIRRDTSLLDVVLSFGEASGQTIILKGNARATLASRDANLSGPIDIPAQDAHQMFELLLATNGYVLTVDGEGSRRLSITDMAEEPVSYDAVLERALDVDSVNASTLAEHPALLVTTKVDVGNPDADARQVFNSLRMIGVLGNLHRIDPPQPDGPIQITAPGYQVSMLMDALTSMGPGPELEMAVNGAERPRSSKPLWIEPEMSLLHLTEEYADLTGRLFICRTEVESLLSAAELDLGKGLGVAPGGMDDCYQALIANYGFTLIERQIGEHSILLIQQPRLASHSKLIGIEFVSAAELDAARGDSARRILTVVSLPNTDTRQLSNAMRTMITDTHTQSMIPMGDSSNILLSGLAPGVWGQSRMLKMIDRASVVKGGEFAELQRVFSKQRVTPTVVNGELRVDPAGTMLDLVRQFEQLSDVRFLFDQETKSSLKQTYPGLLDTLVSGADQAEKVFEHLLIHNEFAILDTQLDEPRLLVLQSLKTAKRNTFRSSAVYFGGGHDERLRHPARLYSHLVHLPGTDVRQLSNALRTLITDANTQQMLPAGNTDVMVLVGFGPSIECLAEVLQSMSEPAVRSEGCSYFELPQASEALDIPSGASLSQVLIEVERLTGTSFMMSDDLRRRMDSTPAGLSTATSIPAPAAQRALEVMLASNEIALFIHQDAAPPLATVYSLNTRYRYRFQGALNFMPESQLPELLTHPAIVATTVVSLPGLDVRQLSNSMRGLITDASTQQILPAGASANLVLRGTGPRIVRLVEMLREHGSGKSSPSAESIRALPRCEQDLRLTRDAGLSGLVADYERITGQILAIDKRTREALQAIRLELPRDMRIPAGKVQSTFESLLVENGFALGFTGGGSPLALSIVPLAEAGERVILGGLGLFASAATLEELADHPGLFVFTRVELPGVDTKQLAKTPMGERFSALPSRRMVPLADSNALVLVGLGAELHSMVQSLQQAAGAPQRK